MCVLLVEDEPLIREVMAEALQDAGYEVFEAADGNAAIKALEQTSQRFSVVLTDVHMPGQLDGFAVAARAREIIPGIAVIIATGRPDGLQERWRSEAGYQLLRKPYLPSKMVEVVQSLIG